MGLFRNKDADPSGRPRNPDAYFMFKLLAAGYLLYLLWDIVKMYIAGGEDQPSVLLLVFSLIVLGGGGVFIAITSFNQWRRFKKEEKEELEAAQLSEPEESGEETEEFEEDSREEPEE